MLESAPIFTACFASAWMGLRILDFFWRPIGIRPFGGSTLSLSCDGPSATVSRIMPYGKAKDFLACRIPGERHPVYPRILASTGSRITGAYPSGRWLRWFPPLLAEVTTTYGPDKDSPEPEYVNSPRASGPWRQWDRYPEADFRPLLPMDDVLQDVSNFAEGRKAVSWRDRPPLL